MEEITNTATEASQMERKPYSTPTLTDFGSFAEITQGAAGAAATDAGVYS